MSYEDYEELCEAVYRGDITAVQTSIDKKLVLTGQIFSGGGFGGFGGYSYGYGSGHEEYSYSSYENFKAYDSMGLAKIAWLRNHYLIAKLLLDNGARNDLVSVS